MFIARRLKAPFSGNADEARGIFRTTGRRMATPAIHNKKRSCALLWRTWDAQQITIPQTIQDAQQQLHPGFGL